MQSPLFQPSGPSGEDECPRPLDQKRSRHQYIKPQPQVQLSNDCLPHAADSEDLSSFFDFDYPLNHDAPKKVEMSKELGFGHKTGWDSLSLQPLSPPESAVYPDGTWQTFDYLQQPPHNVLTHIDPSRARSQYGQNTPPDDEQFSSLDSELLMHQQEENSSFPKDPLNAKESKRKQPSDAKESNAPSSKRVRKNGGRGLKSSALDPNNPEDCRRSKFLERNRVAASKCRQKKKEWTNNIESQARQLQQDSTTLHHLVDSLREEILFLKGEMLKHSACANSDIQEYLQRGVKAFHELSDGKIKQETSPLRTAPPSPALSSHSLAHPSPLDPSVFEQTYLDEPSRRPSVNDETLERLLKSHFIQDTSDDGIAHGLVR
ncbi:MAG: hypothetical protein Q9195_002358 [Heterodermia aff. obscurata]